MVSKYYKAITTFVVGFGLFLVSVLADPDISAALPDGWLKGLTLVVVPAVIAAGAFLQRNEHTVTEAEELVNRARARVATGKQPA